MNDTQIYYRYYEWLFKNIQRLAKEISTSKFEAMTFLFYIFAFTCIFAATWPSYIELWRICFGLFCHPDDKVLNKIFRFSIRQLVSVLQRAGSSDCPISVLFIHSSFLLSNWNGAFWIVDNKAKRCVKAFLLSGMIFPQEDHILFYHNAAWSNESNTGLVSAPWGGGIERGGRGERKGVSESHHRSLNFTGDFCQNSWFSYLVVGRICTFRPDYFYIFMNWSLSNMGFVLHMKTSRMIQRMFY